jgi:hypothetical protein
MSTLLIMLRIILKLRISLKEKQIKAIGKWFDEKIKETYIKILVEYRDCDFQTIG